MRFLAKLEATAGEIFFGKWWLTHSMLYSI